MRDTLSNIVCCFLMSHKICVSSFRNCSVYVLLSISSIFSVDLLNLCALMYESANCLGNDNASEMH